jgi:hypothetical protein
MLGPAARTNSALLSSGAVLIQDSMMLPDVLKIETSIYSHDWRVVNALEGVLETKIRAVGWNFFFMAGKMKSSAFGALTPSTLRRALKGIFRRVQQQHFNAVEITQIQSRRAIGLIRYITVSAHARHIQRSEQLDGEQQRQIAQAQADWAVS